MSELEEYYTDYFRMKSDPPFAKLSFKNLHKLSTSLHYRLWLFTRPMVNKTFIQMKAMIYNDTTGAEY